MEFKTFEAELGSIYDYFQAKMPTQNTMRLWFADIKFIPSGEPLKFITSGIKNMDALPRNIAKAFKSGWDSWTRINQDKIQQVQNQATTKCAECGGVGLIFFIDQRTEYPYRRVCRCASCKNWESKIDESFPAATVQELENSGFTIDRVKRVPNTIRSPGGITKLADRIGNLME
jgi:hypothetical protein